MSRKNTLNDSKTIVNKILMSSPSTKTDDQPESGGEIPALGEMQAGFSLNDLMAALADSDGKQRPVERWNPPYCGEMDMVIKSDGTWWHEGGMITRAPLVKLFASILRKDEDGRTYLVTPVEKIGIQVERAPFIATQLDVQGTGAQQRLFFTTNMDDVIEAGRAHPIRVETDPKTLQPAPFVLIRGRLEALITRSVFYELVALAQERAGLSGAQLGVYAGDIFFPLGPEGAHQI